MLSTNTLETQETNVLSDYKKVKSKKTTLAKPQKVSPKLAQYFAELDDNLQANAHDDEIGYSHEKVLRELGL